ncbi:MAG: MarR family transcriptional regulator [Lentisphaeria bacterium]|jgi:DNA-binding MarR family transcriptional regulator|nr:MarR family transcriptional regulator [Lentisphaeria bacterium]
MKKGRKNNQEQVPLTGKPEHLLGRVEVFKKMCRMLEMKRKRFIENDWQHYAKLIPRQQFLHLMMVRHSLPCNLAKIMQVTGMTSAGASIFVDKMVKQGALERIEDPNDRRNVIVTFTPRAEKITARIDDRLNQYIFHFFADCSPEELETLEAASRLVCRVLDAREDEEI